MSKYITAILVSLVLLGGAQVAAAQSFVRYAATSCVGRAGDDVVYAGAKVTNRSQSADGIAWCPGHKTVESDEYYCWKARVQDLHPTYDMTCRAAAAYEHGLFLGASQSTSGVGAFTLSHDELFYGEEPLQLQCSLPRYVPAEFEIGQPPVPPQFGEVIWYDFIQGGCLD